MNDYSSTSLKRVDYFMVFFCCVCVSIHAEVQDFMSVFSLLWGFAVLIEQPEM